VAVTDNTCAILMEPVQGEGGVNLVDEQYLAAVKKLCEERDVLLIFDEVQTGMGRTGRWFGYQNYKVTPDIMALAKALGGGVPIGAIVAKPEIADFLKPGTHAATFGGNPLACAAANAVFDVIETDGLIERGREVSELIFERLQHLAKECNIIKNIRGKGLMIGIELDAPGDKVFEYCLKNYVRINCTQGNVLRMLPAMNIPFDLLHDGLDVLGAGVKNL